MCRTCLAFKKYRTQLECGPMPSVMAAMPNIIEDAKAVDISCSAPTNEKISATSGLKFAIL